MSDYPPGMTTDEMIRGGLLDDPDVGPWVEQLDYTDVDPDDPVLIRTIDAMDAAGHDTIIDLDIHRGDERMSVEMYLADVLFIPGGCWASGKPTDPISATSGDSYRARWTAAQVNRYVLTYRRAGKDCDYRITIRAVHRGQA